MNSSLTSRRQFIQHLAVAGTATALAGPKLFARPRAHADTKLRVLSIGVIGTIGGADRQTIASHPLVEMVGLCDVDSNALAEAAKDHPNAFKVADYREAFDKHGDKFDGVIVSTPDHSHCSIMTMALARGKHVYGQKPLVQQLEELNTIEQAIKARPNLVTQVGAQRIQSPVRRAAVDILKSGGLGKVIEVHVAFGNGALAGGFYFADGKLGDPIQPPQGFDYNLWLNGAQKEPCRPQMVQRQWRSWWKYGGGQITDWVVHLVDVVFYAFPELQSPNMVCTRTPTRDVSNFHADRVSSVITYPVKSDKFANTTCNFHFYDTDLKPDRAQLGIGPGEWPGGIFTIVVCEGGTLLLAPEGPIEVWRDGQKTDGMQWPGLPKYESFNHWHAWVDKALGKETQHLWAPFSAGIRCTEPGLLCVKASKYPGQMLEWDRKSLTFTNHPEATKTIVRREYRKEFAPVIIK
jgi:predicted dehydrogenase